MIKIGSVTLVGGGEPLPRNRAEAKRVLKSVAKVCGVKSVYFVRAKHTPHGGYYDHALERIVVVEQEGKRKVPMYTVVWRFLHELTHHLHREGGIFNAYYYKKVKLDDGTTRSYSNVDLRRAALRAERHANQKACELAYEFFRLEITHAAYSKEYLQKSRPDIYS